jgi:putative membrane protein
MMDGWGTPGWGPGFGIVFMILFWGLIIFGIVAIVKWLAGTSANAGGALPPKSARQILDERYARGEIDRDEYEQKRRDLEQ